MKGCHLQWPHAQKLPTVKALQNAHNKQKRAGIVPDTLHPSCKGIPPACCSLVWFSLGWLWRCAASTIFTAILGTEANSSELENPETLCYPLSLETNSKTSQELQKDRVVFMHQNMQESQSNIGVCSQEQKLVLEKFRPNRKFVEKYGLFCLCQNNSQFWTLYTIKNEYCRQH